jgi:hypothetical protein
MKTMFSQNDGMVALDCLKRFGDMRTADVLFAKNTGFKTLNDCLSAQADGYRPSFYEKHNSEIKFLADAYDYVAELRGLPMRAYRPESGRKGG